MYITSQTLQAVFKVNAKGELTRVAGTGLDGGISPNNQAVDTPVFRPEGVAVDSTGNLYVGYAGNLDKVALDGSISPIFWLRDFGQCEVSFERPSGLAVDASGNLYFADEDTGKLVQITPSGVATCLDYLHQPEGIAIAPDGNVYVADPIESVIWKISSEFGGAQSVFAGNSTRGFSGDGGPATKAALNTPYGVAVDRFGNVYIADTYNYRIRKVKPEGVISTIAGNGTPGYSGDGGPAVHAQFMAPFGLAVDQHENVYVADNGAAAVRRISAGGTIFTFAGGNKTGDGGQAVSAQLDSPAAVEKDAQGNVYIAEFDGNRVRKVAPNGKITTVAGTGAAGFSGDGGPAAKAELNNPIGVTLDSTGNLYIAELGNARIRRVAPDGKISTLAGGGNNFADNIPAVSAAFSVVQGIAVDPTDNLYVSDQGRVRKVDRAGIITTVAGNGKQGYSGDNGTATQAELNVPTGLAVDSSGNLYIADLGNLRIRKVTPGGIITTVAGGGTQTSSTGPATGVQLAATFGVAVDHSDNLFIADLCLVRRVAGGNIATVAGNQTCEYSGDGGPATAAGMKPVALTLDATGKIYVADKSSNTIRLLTPAAESSK